MCRALALVALLALLAGQRGVAAFDVRTDDYASQGVLSCAHEQMFDEAMRFYRHLVVSNRFSQEIIAHAADIRAGVGAPDAGDPLYDNTGAFDALITITHFWQPDQSIGQPQVQVLDPYANAFNAAQGLWTRAEGLGDIKSNRVKSLLAKLENAAKKYNSGHCTPALNMYGAFINEVQAQTGKSITAFAAAILIADAEYLIVNCP